MTRFTVTWWPAAEEELSRLWLEVDDRRALSKASDEIDRQLASDPSSLGEPLSERIRSLAIAPLGVLYLVEELDRKVVVLLVRLIAP